MDDWITVGKKSSKKLTKSPTSDSQNKNARNHSNCISQDSRNLYGNIEKNNDQSKRAEWNSTYVDKRVNKPTNQSKISNIKHDRENFRSIQEGFNSNLTPFKNGSKHHTSSKSNKADSSSTQVYDHGKPKFQWQKAKSIDSSIKEDKKLEPSTDKKKLPYANNNNTSIHLQVSITPKSNDEDQYLQTTKMKDISLKKQQKKENKKKLREQKARDLEDQKRRSTKFSFISSDMIDNLTSKRTDYKPKNSFHQNTSSNESFVEYPSLQSGFSSRSFSNKHNTSTDKNSGRGGEPTSAKGINKTSDRKDNQQESEFKENNEGSLGNAKWNNGKLLNSNSRKVKTKDPITVDLSNLLKAKKITSATIISDVSSRPKHSHSKTKNSLNKFTEKRGIHSENKKKKLTTLRKCMNRQKEKEKEQLNNFLKGGITSKIVEKPDKLSSDNDDDSLSEKNDEPLPPGNKTFTEKLPVSELPLTAIEDNPTLLSQVDGSDMFSPHSKSVMEESSNTHPSEVLPTLDCVSDTEVESPDRNSSPLGENQMNEVILRLRFLAHPVFSNSFREYCSHIVTPEINESVTAIVKSIVMFQQRLFEQDPIKAKARRRYYCGFRESLRYMNRAQCLIVAPNVRFSPGEGCLNEIVKKVIESATASKAPVIFALNRKKLSDLCRLPKKTSVSCITIVNIQGCQEMFNKLLLLVSDAVRELQARLNSLGHNVTESS